LDISSTKSSSPSIHEACCTLYGKQEELVNNGLKGIAFCLVPQTHFPASLSQLEAMASSDKEITFLLATKKKKKKKKKRKKKKKKKSQGAGLRTAGKLSSLLARAKKDSTPKMETPQTGPILLTTSERIASAQCA
jgi:hypothetical protein